MNNKKTNIVLVDDHKLIRHGLKLILESKKGLSIVGEACNGQEAIEQCSLHNPSIIIMDINMPQMNGLEAIRRLKECGVSSKVIILTASKKREYLIAANKLGVRGYLLKDCEPSSLIKAVMEVSLGRTYLDPQVALLLPSSNGPEDDEKNENLRKIELLSKREFEVLELLSRGKSNRHIGDELYISEKTVKNHLTQIYKKIGVKDRVEAAIFTYDNIKDR